MPVKAVKLQIKKSHEAGSEDENSESKMRMLASNSSFDLNNSSFF